MMKSLIPTKQQWRNWPLPSKLTALGTLIGVIALVYAISSDFLLSGRSRSDEGQGRESGSEPAPQTSEGAILSREQSLSKLPDLSEYVKRSEVKDKLDCAGDFFNRQKDDFILQYRGKRVQFPGKIMSVTESREIRLYSHYFRGTQKIKSMSGADFGRLRKEAVVFFDCSIADYCEDVRFGFDGWLVFDNCWIVDKFR